MTASSGPAALRGRGVRRDADAPVGADRLLDAVNAVEAVDADLALGRGRIRHARFLSDGVANRDELARFERAAGLYRALGGARGEAEARFWVGCFHQVVGDDYGPPSRRRSAPPRPPSRRWSAPPSGAGARRRVGRAGRRPATLSYALCHLGIAEHRAGRTGATRDRLEESLRLRREIGFAPGVAANLVGLAYVAADEGRRDDARALLDEAQQVAEAAGAHAVAASVDQARRAR